MAISSALQNRLRSAVKDEKAVSELVTLLNAVGFGDVTAPAAMAAVTFTTHSWDGATSPTAAEGNKIVADLAAVKTAVDANNAAIDSILAAT